MARYKPGDKVWYEGDSRGNPPQAATVVKHGTKYVQIELNSPITPSAKVLPSRLKAMPDALVNLVTPSRKSRSFTSPEYRASILRYAPEEAFRNAVRDVNHRVTQYVQAAYRSDPTFFTNHERIDRLTAIMAPAVQAGQLQIADLTNAHLSSLFDVKHPPSPNLSSFQRPGVDKATELSRPFWTAIKTAREQGKSFEQALAAGEARLTKMVETDLQMAKVRQAREVLKAGGIHRYARVTGGSACWLCEIAATQVYWTEDLLPIHPSCNCSVQPIPDGGEDEIRKGFTPDQILAHSDEQVKRMTGLVENEAPLEDYQDLVAVREHGEIGPVLTWKHQSFTGPADLPIPPSREVLEYQAYQALKAEHGVTIDLAGNVPTNGFAYAPFKNTEMRIPIEDFTHKDIDRFITMHAEDLAKPGNHLGMWEQNGAYYLDISRVGAADATTLAKAQGAQQIAAYDLGKHHDINLGVIKDDGTYRRLGSPDDLLGQYRGEIARADERASAASVPDMVRRQLAGAGTESVTRPAARTAAQKNRDALQAISAEMTSKHEALNLVQLGDIKPTQAQSIQRAVDDVLAKHPVIQVKGISVGDTYNRTAYAETARMVDTTTKRVGKQTFNLPGSKDVPISWSTVTVNGHALGRPKDLERDYIRHVEAKLFAKGSGDPVYDIVVHELGHALDNAGGRFARQEAENYLLSAYQVKHPKATLEDKGFRKWLTDNMPLYSFRLKRDIGEVMPYVLPGAPLNAPEALAEAFKDVFINGDKASPTSQVLYKLLVDSANEAKPISKKLPQKVALKVTGRVGKPYRVGGKRPAAMAPAMKPAEKVAAKEAKRAKKPRAPRLGAGGKFRAPHDLAKGMPVGPGAGTEFLDHHKMVENILVRYRDCLKPENKWIIDAGKTWYPKAGEWLDWLIGDSGFTGTRERAAALAAAFSENTGWSQNMLKAENFFRGFKITEGSPGLNTARRVAAALGDPIDALHTNDIHWKTVNFARAILGDPDAVAIDRWAARVAMGTDDARAAGLAADRRGAYDKIANAYRDAAKLLGLKPSELQAITWVHAVPPDATVRYFRAHGQWGWAK